MSSRTAQALLDLLRNGVPHRNVYIGQDGKWYVTYGGGGPWPHEVVYDLVRQKLIADVYDDLPDACFHVGPTIDTAATQAARAAQRNKRVLVYKPESHPSSDG